MPQPDAQQIPAVVYIAIFSAVIALCALVVSITQMYLQRRHYRLSVRPYLDFNRKFGNHTIFEVEVFNAGSGTAIITDVQMIVGNDIITSPSGKLILSALNGAGIPENSIKEYYAPNLPKCLKADGILVFLKLDHQIVCVIPQKPSNKIGWLIEYKSIYGEKFKLKIPLELD
jgi:hypothetical protein